jgi:hypothetical protein
MAKVGELVAKILKCRIALWTFRIGSSDKQIFVQYLSVIY